MKAVVVVLLALLLILLTGCSTQRNFREVPQCQYAAPPEPERYLNASDAERAVQWSLVYTRQLAFLKMCNADIEKVNLYNQDLR